MRARLRARPRRRRRLRARALPGDGAVAGRAVPDRCRGVTADPAGDLARLADRLRAAPLRGSSTGRAGGGPATLTALALADLMFDSDYNPAIRAGIPAAVRAALDHRDPAPLLRLADAAAGPRRAPAGRASSPPPATRRCARRRRCRGRAARRSASARRGPATRRPARAGRVLPVRLRGGAADEIDLCLRWPEASARAGAGRRLPGGPGADPPGRRGPAHAAGGLRARRGGAAGRAAGGRAGGRARGRGRRPVALRRAAAVRVPARPAARRRRASAWRRACPRPACRRRRCASWRRRPGVPGRAGRTVGGARRRRSTTSPSRSRRRSARRWRAPGLRGGTFRLRRRAIVLRRAAGGPGRPRQRHGCRGAGARALRISGRARGRAAGCGSRRAARCAGGSAGGRVRGRLRAGPPRPVASGARSRGEVRHDSGTERPFLPSGPP